MRFQWTKRLLPFESVSEKIKVNSSQQQKQDFLDTDLPLMEMMVSKKI